MKPFFTLFVLPMFLFSGLHPMATEQQEVLVSKPSTNKVVNATVSSTSPFKVSHAAIKEINAKVQGTNTTTYGYILKNQTPSTSFIISGYFFYGECLVFGTLFIDNDGDAIFAPCGFNCIGTAFAPICPEEGMALCKLTFEE